MTLLSNKALDNLKRASKKQYEKKKGSFGISISNFYHKGFKDGFMYAIELMKKNKPQ